MKVAVYVRERGTRKYKPASPKAMYPANVTFCLMESIAVALIGLVVRNTRSIMALKFEAIAPMSLASLRCCVLKHFPQRSTVAHLDVLAVAGNCYNRVPFGEGKNAKHAASVPERPHTYQLPREQSP